MASVLIVDDDSTIRVLFEAIMEEFGYDVFTASEGSKTLTMLETIRPDLLMIDLMMPGLNGAEVIREVRVFDQKVAIVVVTGSMDTKLVEQAIEWGANQVLQKPLDTGKLSKVLSELDIDNDLSLEGSIGG